MSDLLTNAFLPSCLFWCTTWVALWFYETKICERWIVGMFLLTLCLWPGHACHDAHKELHSCCPWPALSLHGQSCSSVKKGHHTNIASLKHNVAYAQLWKLHQTFLQSSALRGFSLWGPCEAKHFQTISRSHTETLHSNETRGALHFSHMLRSCCW